MKKTEEISSVRKANVIESYTAMNIGQTWEKVLHL